MEQSKIPNGPIAIPANRLYNGLNSDIPM